jgi:hypothetical protein
MDTEHTHTQVKHSTIHEWKYKQKQAQGQGSGSKYIMCLQALVLK